MQPQQPCRGTACPGSTGGSAKGAISGHLPGFSPPLFTFPAAHPHLLQLLGLAVPAELGVTGWAGSRGPLQVSACPPAPLLCGVQQGLAPLSAGLLPGGQQLFLPWTVLNQQLWQKALVGAGSAMIPKKGRWGRWGFRQGWI